MAKPMKLYFAPLEGITGYPYRNAHRAFFMKPDRYYTPFITANQNMILANREKRDIVPENNRGVPLVPQVLSNKAEQFAWVLSEMAERGYTEVNLNLGCPSPTVVTRGRGSAMLADPEDLDRFFDDSFREMDRQGIFLRVSVKTRIGSADTSVAGALTEVYNKYPLCEVIIHPRTRLQQYGGQPDLAVFREMLASSAHPVCYNGNICTEGDYRRLREMFPEEEYPMLRAVMLGRGLLRDPMLAEKIAAGEAGNEAGTETFPIRDEREMLTRFHGTYLANIRREIPEENNVLMKMKEFWTYLGDRFGDSEKLRKKIRKTRSLTEYEGYARRIFEGCDILPAEDGLQP